MAPAQYLAVFFVGAFLITLVTAIFYIFTVRDRLLEEPEPAAPEHLDLDEQRTALRQLNLALAQHTAQLQSQARPGAELNSLAEMLRSQNNVVLSINTLLNEHSTRLIGLDDRLARQESALRDATQQITDRFASLDERLARQDDIQPPGLQGLIQAQSDLLMSISTRLDEWAASRQQVNDPAAEQARILAGLDRELAEHAQAIQQMDTKVSEHTTLLVTAASERREQAGLLERILYELRQIGPALTQTVAPPPRVGQDRLTDINGIGPVYAGKLYENGIYTFHQLASMTPDEIYTILNLPAWRVKTAKVDSWIDQAGHFASQREKVDQ